MFFLKKIFQKKLNVDETEDLLFENGVEPKFAELIISKIKDNTSKEEVPAHPKNKVHTPIKSMMQKR